MQKGRSTVENEEESNSTTSNKFALPEWLWPSDPDKDSERLRTTGYVLTGLLYIQAAFLFGQVVGLAVDLIGDRVAQQCKVCAGSAPASIDVRRCQVA